MPCAAFAQDALDPLTQDPLRGPDVPFDSHWYGPGKAHSLRFSRPRSATNPPLVIFIGDEGWQPEADRYPMHLLRSALWQHGYASAAITYRDLERDEPIDVSIANVLLAIRWLQARQDKLRFDPNRIVLMGNGPGAHIATLLGVDPKYLGSSFGAVKGVVSVNGEMFDVPTRLKEVSPYRQKLLRKVFGADPARHSEYSPARHLAQPNAPAFLFQAVANKPQLQTQAMQMRELLARSRAKTAYAPLKPWLRDAAITYYASDTHEGFGHLLRFLSETVGRQPITGRPAE
jgi:acetyl esterase/lipase